MPASRSKAPARPRSTPRRKITGHSSPAQAWRKPDLRGKVALVTGASRGGGRGIALALGEAGATVIVTARSVRGEPTPDGMPGTVEETAEQVTARGGTGIAHRCDHADPAQVRALAGRIGSEHGGLDVLVNNAWGGYEGEPPMPGWFWTQPVEAQWRGMFTHGLWPHLLTSHALLPLMLGRKGGLVAGTIAWDRDVYLGGSYDVAKHAVRRLYWGLARELRQHGIASVAVAPGFMRTERVLAAFKTDEARWREVPDLRRTETPEYVGRGIASLAGDPRKLRHTGKALRAGDLARLYGFRDVDGRKVAPFTLPKSAEQYARDMEQGTFQVG